MTPFSPRNGVAFDFCFNTFFEDDCLRPEEVAPLQRDDEGTMRGRDEDAMTRGRRAEAEVLDLFDEVEF